MYGKTELPTVGWLNGFLWITRIFVDLDRARFELILINEALLYV